MSRDPRKHYDALRSLPPARDERGRWVIARHADVVAVAADPVTFSSAVSRFLQVPNGLDGEAHRAARALLDPFFAADRMEAFEPAIRSVDVYKRQPPAEGRPLDRPQRISGCRLAALRVGHGQRPCRAPGPVR